MAGVAALLAGGGVAAALSLSSTSGGASGAQRPVATGQVEAAKTTRRTTPQQAVVATALRRVSVYRHPGERNAFTSFGKTNGYGQPRVFLVQQRLPGWEKVYLPMRPDGITGWVRDSSVSLAYDPYRVVVSLGAHRIWVYRGSKRIFTTKAGVGRSITATPIGTYFLVMLLKQPDPNGVYGPYAFGTSAFSHVLYHFGAGPGQIGLHGTDYPQGLGTNVSHGCIRISNAAITKLAHLLPLGTPLKIES
jgi:lipoprotein-anchoring transpeptidase ErfK/SrfK